MIDIDLLNESVISKKSIKAYVLYPVQPIKTMLHFSNIIYET